VKTKDLRIQNEYTLALEQECRSFAYNEERAPELRDQWRAQAFGKSTEVFLDLEIGTGNGVFFHAHCLQHPERNLVGVELKYKPLIQTIRRNLRVGIKNGCVARTHAFNIDQVFGEGELNDVYIHFPDPWTSPRKPKNRMLNARMLNNLWKMQRSGSRINFKTDSRELFDWTLEQLQPDLYELAWVTRDLHAEKHETPPLMTQFEKIFVRQGIPIHALRLLRKDRLG
jgi:tRNA (guanine-N7-)-methyltransferase